MKKQRLLALSLGLSLAGAAWLTLPSPALAARETTAELVATLESEASLEDKAIACRKLGEFGTAEAVPALASLLDHQVLGAYARSGLERLADLGGAAALRSALGTTEGEPLLGVIGSLGALQDEQAVGALSELVHRDDPAVTRAALLALGRVSSPEAVRVLMTALSSGSEGAAAACLIAAEQQLKRAERDQAVALYDAVRAADVSEPYRLGATRGAIVSRESVPFLMERLGSDDLSIRDVALLTIREMPSDALADALHARIPDAPPDLQAQLITALRDCHSERSFRVVRSQLDSDTPAVRRAALGALSTVGGGPELASTLLDVVHDRPSPEERQAAIELLTRMEGAEEVDRVILERLRQAKDVGFRTDAIRILGSRRSTVAVDDLLTQARDEAPKVRVAALRAMRRVVGPQEVPVLITLVKAEQEDAVRAAAVAPLISACGDHGPSGELVLAELQQATDLADRDVWTRVLTAVGYPGALPTILAGLEDADPDTVTWTINRLSEWPDPTPIGPLLPVMESSPMAAARRRACSAVIRLTTNAADRQQRPDDVLVAWFGRADAAVETIEEKRQLLSGLARVHTLASFHLLEPYVEDPEVRDEALYAMLAVGSPLVRAGQGAVVGKALPEDAAIEDEGLRRKIGKLREQAHGAD